MIFDLFEWQNFVGEQSILKVNGRHFRCDNLTRSGRACNCNVFTTIGHKKYRCNACSSEYSGE